MKLSILIYTGHQWKVNELEYGELLPEVSSLVNSESEIHRYLPYTCASALHYTICYRVTWIQVQGTKYVEGSVVVLDSSEVLPTFGIIINIVLITLDEPYLVCEVLHTEEFFAHLHAFIVQRDKPIPIVFCKPDELSDHHTLGLYTLRLFQDTHVTQYIVPQYHLM